jgi:hypothetical protein
MSTTVIVNVRQLDPEDYYDKTGNAAMAIELAEKNGGTQAGGGTDFTTGYSDIDFEVDVAQVFGFTAALEAFGLIYKVFIDD